MCQKPNLSETELINIQTKHRNGGIWIVDAKKPENKGYWPYNPGIIKVKEAELIRIRLEKQKGKNFDGVLWEAWTSANIKYVDFFKKNIMCTSLEERFPARINDVKRVS